MALDFETADYGADSACALGMVRVENGRIVRKTHFLIRPPRPQMFFTYIHGITWEDVRSEPAFAERWPAVRRFIAGADFLAAHNARFDQGVLRACLGAAGLSVPEQSFLCTVILARRAFGIYPTKLPDVCRRLGIPLRHHEALSDAEACARIVLAAREKDPGLAGLIGSVPCA